MISFIKGVLFSIEEENVIVDVAGVGYHLLVPPRIFPSNKKPGDEIFFYTHLLVKEDNWQLIGFPKKEQLAVFRLLISVTGIGAKLGVAILNHYSHQEVISLVVQEDNQGLSCVPGVGRKTSQRLILELKEKFKKMEQDLGSVEIPLGQKETDPIDQDVVLALTQLGYSAPEARSALLRASQALGAGADSQAQMKGALKLLGKF